MYIFLYARWQLLGGCMGFKMTKQLKPLECGHHLCFVRAWYSSSHTGLTHLTPFNQISRGGILPNKITIIVQRFSWNLKYCQWPEAAKKCNIPKRLRGIWHGVLKSIFHSGSNKNKSEENVRGTQLTLMLVEV